MCGACAAHGLPGLSFAQRSFCLMECLQRIQTTVLAISFMVSNVEGECPGAKWPFAEPAPASSFRVECHRASWKRTIPIHLPLPPVARADIVPVVTKMHLLNSMPIVALPTGLSNTNTGNLVADWLPLVTMLPCVPTLHLYYKAKRWPDLVRSCSSSTACSIVSVQQQHAHPSIVVQ